MIVVTVLITSCHVSMLPKMRIVGAQIAHKATQATKKGAWLTKSDARPANLSKKLLLCASSCVGSVMLPPCAWLSGGFTRRWLHPHSPNSLVERKAGERRGPP